MCSGDSYLRQHGLSLHLRERQSLPLFTADQDVLGIEADSPLVAPSLWDTPGAGVAQLLPTAHNLPYFALGVCLCHLPAPPPTNVICTQAFPLSHSVLAVVSTPPMCPI